MVDSGQWVNNAAEVGCLLSHASVFFSLAEAQVLGGVESIYVGTNIKTDMLEDAETEINCILKGLWCQLYTKVVSACQLMKQLLENLRSVDVDNRCPLKK